mmetsp:Transcript_21146/g.54534  ORF Transcript_21146/g.54534 Transcript_21146/m.54534 type:complete len:313 (+) Transcript_21146:814-1752(+)
MLSGCERNTRRITCCCSALVTPACGEVGSSGTAEGSAYSRLSASWNVVPRPSPSELMLSSESLCMARIDWVMEMPRPVPPLPCIWPAPTCVKTRPRLSVRTSLSESPIPSSMIAMLMRAKSALSHGAPSHARNWMRPPRSVNLSAFDTPLLRHCCSRRLSPMNAALTSVSSTTACTSCTPFSSVSPSNVAYVSASSRASVKGWWTRTSRPMSMRSKSSMSDTMHSISVEHAHSASMLLCTASLASGVAPSMRTSILVTLRMESSGERRSCITTRMSFERASAAACATRSSDSRTASVLASSRRLAAATSTCV